LAKQPPFVGRTDIATFRDLMITPFVRLLKTRVTFENNDVVRSDSKSIAKLVPNVRRNFFNPLRQGFAEARPLNV
jgi:hypothetical protein